MEWIMPPFKISVRPRLIKCTTNHQNWACTAQMHPREQLPPPPQLATFSKPLVEIQYYSPLEKIWGLCVDSEETDRFFFFFFGAGLAVRASPQHFHLPLAPTRSIAWQLWLQQHWQDPVAPEGVMRLCIPVAMIFGITQRRLEAALVVLSFM